MKQKNIETLLYSTVGIVAMFVVLLAFYVVSSTVKQRIDLTADKSYTLSDGTRKIVGDLKKRVTIRFFCTQNDNAMPVALKTYARRVEDLLGEYKQAAKGKIIIEKYDPAPDSDAEDLAQLNGVDGQATSPFGGDKVYLGLVVSILNEKVAIPWLSPDREKLLEYDISRAIARVVNPTPPIIGMMSAMPVFGTAGNPMMMMQRQRGQDAWVFISELKKDFTVREVPMTSTKIDNDIKVLVVIEPRDISDTAQYAIDQFVLRGGRLLALLDPHAYFDQKQDQMAQVIGESSGQSSMDKLLKAWGVEMDTSKVVADLNFGTRNGANVMPTVLGITREGINENDTVGAQVDNLILAFAGAFTGKPVDGLKESVIVHSSKNSQLVDGMLSAVGAQQIAKDFKASGTNYDIAVRLTGKFKTAFPDGRPKDAKKDAKKDEEKKDEKNADSEKQLKEGNGDGAVILVADSDMINDQIAVRVQEVLGYKVVSMPNGNLNFVQSLVEQLAGDSSLISLRSRASMNRPFTRVRDMQAAAEKKYQSRIKELEGSLAETQRKLGELQSNKKDPQQRFILSPDQQKEVDKFRQTEASAKKDLKELRKNLRKDVDHLEFWTKVVNIGLMPLLVAVSGIVLAVVKRKKTAAK